MGGPWEGTRPRDPYVDGQGRVWFVGQHGEYVAYLEPNTGTFKRYDLDKGTGPHNLIVDDAGFVWYSGNRAAYIGRLNPTSGEITRYSMPVPAARDPHTLVFDENADIWFNVQGGNFVGKLGTRTGAVQLIPVPTERARPYGIKVDTDNRPWFVEHGTNKLASINPETLEFTEIALPRTETRPRRLDLTSNGKLWHVDYTGAYLCPFDPVTGAHEEWLSPGGTESRPYGMAVDDQDRLWYVETGVDPRTNTFTDTTEIPSGGGTVRHMYYDAPGVRSGSEPTQTTSAGPECHSELQVGARLTGIAALLALAASPTAGYREGPPPAHTGGFGENTYQACHFDNNLNDGTGSLTLEGIPPTFTADERYR